MGGTSSVKVVGVSVLDQLKASFTPPRTLRISMNFTRVVVEKPDPALTAILSRDSKPLRIKYGLFGLYNYLSL